MSRETVINREEEPLTRGTVINREEEPLTRGTVINREEEPLTRGTVINREEEPFTRGTVVNREEEPLTNSTVVNAEEGNDPEIEQLKRGDELPGGYMILKILSKAGGEARLFEVEKDGHIYAAKCYLREKAIKHEVLDKLLESGHKNLPKIYELGTYNGKPFVIMEFYPQGSLEGQILTPDEIEKRFVPDMNEALNELNRLGIIHRDIKPSNITRNADGSYVLMDFGISSVRQDKQSIIATQTGLTFVYAAPEALRDLWLVQSDYFSLGITIYELLTGVLPTDGMTEKELERYALTSKIPIPASVPDRLALLIRGLTYKDITNRKDKSNPNNRWVYEEVCDWLNGKEMTEPGEAAGGMVSDTASAGNIPPYDFMGTKYTDLNELFTALAENWEEGKKVMGRGFLENYFRNNGMNTLAGAAMDATEDGLSDRAYAKFLYENAESLEKIYWCGKKYTEREYGGELLKALWSCREDYSAANIENYVDKVVEPLAQGILTLYYRNIGNAEMEEYIESGKKTVESRLNTDEEGALFAVFLYDLAYSMTGKIILNIEGQLFEDYDSFLNNFEKRLMEENDVTSFDSYCNAFSDLSDETLPDRIQFSVWKKAFFRRAGA